MRETTKFVVLGLLSESPLSGYDIKKAITVRFRFFWSESYGQIYPALKSLLREELIKEMRVKSTSKRTRRVYAITPVGRKTLVAWLMKIPEKEVIRYEMLIKLYFGNLIGPTRVVEYIAEFQKKHDEDLAMLRQFKQEIVEKYSWHDNHPFILSILKLGIEVNSAYVRWAEEARNFIGKSEVK